MSDNKSVTRQVNRSIKKKITRTSQVAYDIAFIYSLIGPLAAVEKYFKQFNAKNDNNVINILQNSRPRSNYVNIKWHTRAQGKVIIFSTHFKDEINIHTLTSCFNKLSTSFPEPNKNIITGWMKVWTRSNFPREITGTSKSRIITPLFSHAIEIPSRIMKNSFPDLQSIKHVR